MKITPKIVAFLSILLGLARRNEASFSIDLDKIGSGENDPACEITSRGNGKARCKCHLEVGSDVTKVKYLGVYKADSECKDKSNVKLNQDEEVPGNNGEASFAFDVIFSPVGNEKQSNIVSFDSRSGDSADGNYFEGCVKIEAMGEDDSGEEIKMTHAFLNIKASVNDDGDFSIDEIDQDPIKTGESLSRQSISDDGNKNVKGEQCGNEKVSVGDDVCVKIILEKEDAISEMDHIESCVFYKKDKQGEKFEAVGVSWTKGDMKDGSCKVDECDLTTILPEVMFQGTEKIFVEGEVDMRAPSGDGKRRNIELRGDRHRRLDHHKERFQTEIEFAPMDDNSAAASTGSNYVKSFVTCLVFFGMALQYL